ncbi:MAG: permease-like cell division protein FtsX [Candidatus Moraniibacteriota bacterium]
MFLALGRTLKEGWSNFMRNGYLSIAAVSVMLLSLFSISALALLMLTGNRLIQNIESKVNISVYFKSDVTEEAILKDKGELENFNEIQSVNYVSKEKALEEFKKNNADEPVILKSLEEIEGNPLLSALIIKANNPAQYELVNDYLKNAPFKEDISRINYAKNKEVIDKLNQTIAQVRKAGMAITGLLSLISILIIFNTIRITIYSHKKEVEVMRLVGASNVYIRLPFIFEGVLYGLVASIISMLLLFVSLRLLLPQTKELIPSVDVIGIYTTNFWKLLGAQILAGAILGIVSSTIAIRKYLKI